MLGNMVGAGMYVNSMATQPAVDKTIPWVTKWKCTRPSYTAANGLPNTPCSAALQKTWAETRRLDQNRQPSSNHEDQNPQAWPGSGEIDIHCPRAHQHGTHRPQMCPHHPMGSRTLMWAGMKKLTNSPNWQQPNGQLPPPGPYYPTSSE